MTDHFADRWRVLLEDSNALKAAAAERRAAAAECAAAGRHLKVVLEPDEHPRCDHCSASPLSLEDLERAGIVHRADEATVARCCALEAIADACLSSTAVDDAEAMRQAVDLLSVAEQRHAGHRSTSGPAAGG